MNVVTDLTRRSRQATQGGYAFVKVYRDTNTARAIYYARYVDWTITTPLLLLDILLLAGLSVGDTLWIVFADIGMIVTGLFGALLPNRYKWGERHFPVTPPGRDTRMKRPMPNARASLRPSPVCGSACADLSFLDAVAGWFAIGCLFMVFIMWGLLFQGRRAAFLRSKKVPRLSPLSPWICRLQCVSGQMSSGCSAPPRTKSTSARGPKDGSFRAICLPGAALLRRVLLLVQIGAIYSTLSLYLLALWWIYPIA